MEEEKSHECPVCGGLEFMKENGYFYCLECQTQCEDIREQLFEDNYDNPEDEDRMFGTPFVRQKKVKKEKSKPKGDDFTSWELYNFILRGLVDELIEYGAPSSLKDTTFQMWAYYLQKIEVAFISKEEALYPKLAANYRVMDAQLLYGLKKRKMKKKPKASSITAELNTTVCGLQDWGSMEIQKQWKRKAKKAYMEKIAETSVAEMSLPDSENSILNLSCNLSASEVDDSLSMGSVSMQLADSSVSSYKMERTEAAKNWIEKKNEKETARLCDSDVFRPWYLTKFRIICLLYLALLYEGSTIQISDILRWIREGHLSYHEAAKHVPENCFVRSVHNRIFSLTSNSPRFADYLESSRYLAGFIKFVEWPDPDVSEIARKYVKELQLPEMFFDLIIRFVVLIPMSYKARVHNFTVRTEIPNYEGRVLAILIIIMKLLFGLDGKTEHQISKAASQLNKWMEQKKDNKKFTKLFVWDDWVKQLVCRTAVLIKYHFPTKQLLCQNSYGNPFAYINYSKKWNDVNKGLLDKYIYCNDNLLRGTEPFLINALTSILGKLQEPECNNDEDIKFPQSVTPYSVYIENIIKKSASANKPLLETSAVKVLTEDFSKCDITYLLKPESLSTIVEEQGGKLKIKNGSVQKKFTKFKYKRLTKNMSHINTYAWVVHCHPSKKNLTPPNSDNEEFYSKDRLRYQKKVEKLRQKNKNKSKYEILQEEVKKIKQKRKGKNKTKNNSEESKVDSHLKKIESCKKEMLKKLKNCDPVVDSCLSRSRKRKMKGSSKISKKTKLSKMFKFYVPCSKYWVHVDRLRIGINEFDSHILHSFPYSFSWLLSECAFVSEMNIVTLYKEVVRIEKLCEKHFK